MIKEGSIQLDLWDRRGGRTDGNGGFSVSGCLSAVLTKDAWCLDGREFYQIQATLLRSPKNKPDQRLACTSHI